MHCLSSLSVAAVLFASSSLALPSLRTSPASFDDYAVKERHPVPFRWTNVGKPSPADPIRLQIALKSANPGLIEQHLLEVSNPQHERYGKHLSAEEIQGFATPSDDTVDLVHAWLAEHGLRDTILSPTKDWVTVHVSIEKAEQLLQTVYSTFEHTDGSTISRAPEWSLPRHLHDHIDLVQPTTSFFLPRAERSNLVAGGESYSLSWWEQVGKHQFAATASDSNDRSIEALCNISFTTPDCIRTLYGTIDYKPQVPDKNSIAITNYLNETNNRDDAFQFLQNFRPEAADAAKTFEIITINDAPDPQGPYSPELLEAGTNKEGNLDAQQVLSVGWPTPLVAYSTGGSPPFIPTLSVKENTNEPYLEFVNYILAQKDIPNVISTSYGEDEQSVPESYARKVCEGFAQLGARGVSLFFSSGDAGVGANGTCFSNTDPSVEKFTPAFPASCPWVTTVGGTEAFQPEVAVKRFGSGAGFSDYFGAPSYQQETVNAYIKSLNGLYDGLYNKSGRGYPDVAAQSNRDVYVWAGNISTIGGTSAAAPTFAAVIGLVNDALIADGKPPLGFLNPWLYGGAYTALNDVTSGSSIGCNGTGFPAQAGWDAVTGFGTPNFAKLVEAAKGQKGHGSKS